MLTTAERQRDSRSMEGVVFVGHNLDPIVGRVFAFFRAPPSQSIVMAFVRLHGVLSSVCCSSRQRFASEP